MSSSKSVATPHTSDNDAVDWLALADQLFPADALWTPPVVNPMAFARNGF